MTSRSNVRVLLVEDEEASATLTKQYLERQKVYRYQLDWINSYDLAMETLSANAFTNYDIILVDYYLGTKTGLDLVKEISSKKLAIPIILLTANDNLNLDLEAMDLGVSDYIVKGKFDAALLDRSIRYSIERKKNQRFLVKQQQKEFAMLRASALADMVAFVAHEINNPLSIIQGHAASAMMALSKPTVDLDKVRGSVKKIESMMERIIEIKKNLQKHYGKVVESTSKLDNITEIIHEALQLCREGISAHHIKIMYDFEKPLMVFCQPVELSQVFVNLITNACEAIKAQVDPWIKIEILAAPDKVKILFTDSGSGIKPEIRQSIFSKYFTTKKEGMGIGLHLSRNIIESFGGELNLNLSSSNTQFEIDLPMGAKQWAHKRYRFLIVDDEIEFATALGENILSQGFKVEVETNPKKAQSDICNGAYDAVITDLDMRELSGIELAMNVFSTLKNPPIFSFMSGYFSPDAKSLIEEKKLGLCFEKPLDIEKLIASTVEAIKSAQETPI